LAKALQAYCDDKVNAWNGCRSHEDMSNKNSQESFDN